MKYGRTEDLYLWNYWTDMFTPRVNDIVVMLNEDVALDLGDVTVTKMELLEEGKTLKVYLKDKEEDKTNDD